jgi:hypothetical protein
MADLPRVLLVLVFIAASAAAQETHNHTAPEKLGSVSFPISCKPAVQPQFNRGVALLHSFAYTAAENAFHRVAKEDPHCAIAHWGMAMAYFRQLWDPPLLPASIPVAQKEIQRAQQIGTSSARERQFIHALGLIYENAATIPYRTRVLNYERAMSDLASQNRQDVEAQVFYALALLANASPTDKTHAKQKQAADLLEPLARAYPQHPGIPHYLIHACDNAELAPRGLAAARAYAQIAPSAPHALHMPSHIFTRLGLWEDSIHSNLAAREAAHRQGDTGEELHAMDYLVYAYLQSGRDEDALQVIRQLKTMPGLNAGDFKIAYASTAMPVRYAMERGQWSDAAAIVPPRNAPPHVAAIAVWARGVGLARSGHAVEAQAEIDRLRQLEKQLRASGNDYWSTQVGIQTREVMAWSAQSQGKPAEAVALMRASADEEDAIEKLPVTPGPIIPAREQLGDLLLEQKHPNLALQEFRTALLNAPGRRGAEQGAAQAARLSRNGQDSPNPTNNERPPSAPVDQRCHIPGPKPVVDIDHAHVRRAGVHHAQQRRQAFERRAIADAGGHGDHRHSDQASHHAGQRPFHPGTHDDNSRPGQRFAMRQQTVNAGDAHVVEALHGISHNLGCHHRLFRHRNVAGSRRDHRDRALAIFRLVTPQGNGAGLLVIHRPRKFLLHRRELFFVGARRQHVAAMFRETRKDPGNLRGSLALPEDDLGHAHAQPPVMIDLGESQVFKRQVPQTIDRVIGREFPRAHLLKQFSNGSSVQRSTQPSALSPSSE